MATFASLLLNLSQSDIVVFGLPVVNRPTQSMIGYFSNDLPLCFGSQLHALSFKDAVRSVHLEMKESIARSQVTYARMVDAHHRAVGTLPSCARRSLYQVMLQYLPCPPGQSTEEMEAAIAAALQDRAQMSEMNLFMFLLGPYPDGSVLGVLRYDSALYKEETMRQLVTTFEQFVELAVADPSQSLESLLKSLLGASQFSAPPQTEVIPKIIIDASGDDA